ncbi:MAG: methyltransferase domain-containing protein [Acidobacteriota bacterium]|jgi:tellurite methyltransferase
MAQPFWEKAYADLDTPAICGGAPSQEIREVALHLPPAARVLDLGCGEGRNALFLAECGFKVTAVDISEAGIRKLDALAREKQFEISSEVADMRTYRFQGLFDLIVSHGCLHLVERRSWQQLIPRFKAHTKPGGFNVVVVFTDTRPPPDDLKEFCLGLFREKEVFSMYSDWEVVLQRSYTIQDQHPGSSPHTHPINKLVARKPSNKPAGGEA